MGGGRTAGVGTAGASWTTGAVSWDFSAAAVLPNTGLFFSLASSLKGHRAGDRLPTPETRSSLWRVVSVHSYSLPGKSAASRWIFENLLLQLWPGCLCSLPITRWGVGTQEGSCLLISGYGLDIHTAACKVGSCHGTVWKSSRWTTITQPPCSPQSCDLLPCHLSKAKAGWAWSVLRWRGLQGKHKS